MHLNGLVGLTRHPLFWLVAALIVVGEMRPIVTPGRSNTEAPVASLTFSFAALLFWGFGVAMVLRATATLAMGLAQRKAVHRSAFNTAQVTLSMAAAGLVLAVTGIHPMPGRPWSLAGGQLPEVALAACAYFAVNFLLVSVAIALHSRARISRDAPRRAALPGVLEPGAAQRRAAGGGGDGSQVGAARAAVRSPARGRLRQRR